MAPPSYKGYPDPSRVVSVEEASRILESRDRRRRTVFVDTRNYWKYAKGHIPGATNLELYAFHWADTTSKTGVEAFAAQMAKLFGSVGVSRTTDVIFYQNISGYDAARGVWLLEFLGNERGRLLDGGLNLWKRRGLPLSKEDSRHERAEFTPRVDETSYVGLDALLGHVRSRDATVIDARNAGEFDGTYRRALERGHIPGSANIEWAASLRRDGTLKDARQLRALYSDVLRGDREVITYCQAGYRAAHSWFVLRLLGVRDVRNYLGSWYEWGNDPRAPVER